MPPEKSFIIDNEEPAAGEDADAPCVLALERVLIHLAASAGII